ncbi:MAG: hypothetical protein VKO21_08485 [Candidatus Sericytochromatia bacterium]|nr:hypothetical protein [Candidatus Sericytochromatia bacterium]
MSTSAQGDRIVAVDFSEDAKLFVYGNEENGAVTVGDVLTGNSVATWQIGSPLRSVHLKKRAAGAKEPGYMVTAVAGGLVDQRVVSGQMPSALVTPMSSFSVAAKLFMAFAGENDRTVWAGGNDNRAALYDMVSGSILNSVSTLGWVRAGDARAGRFAFGADDWMGRVLDLVTGESLFNSPFQTGPILSVSLSGDGSRLALAGADGKVRVYDLVRETLIREWSFTGEIHAVGLSPDGEWLACGGKEAKVRLASVADGRVVLDFLPGGTEVKALRFSAAWADPEGQRRNGDYLLVGTKEGGALLYTISW